MCLVACFLANDNATTPLAPVACGREEGQLDAIPQVRTLVGMHHGKKKSSGREASKKQTPLGLVIVLAAAGGVVIGSASTYILTRPQAAPEQSVSTSGSESPQASQAQTIAMPPQPPFTPPQQQFTPAPQPPGEVPPGKVWSAEHGHWHDAPVPPTFPAPATTRVTPAATPPPPPPPAAAPEKKE